MPRPGARGSERAHLAHSWGKKAEQLPPHTWEGTREGRALAGPALSGNQCGEPGGLSGAGGVGAG